MVGAAIFSLFHFANPHQPVYFTTRQLVNLSTRQLANLSPRQPV